MKSEFGKLKKADFWKGLFLAVITALLSSIVTVAQATFDLKSINYTPILSSAVIAFCSYLIKNIFTNSNDEILKPER